MKKGFNLAVLMLGGNIGDTPAVFNRSRILIQTLAGEIIASSSLYKSEPWGFSDQSGFLNQALTIETALSPEILLQTTASIEMQLGKEATILNGPRVIDIDIMFFNESVINTHFLTIPHPRLHLRRFNLVPLEQLIPDFEHPVLQQKIKTILLNCKDPLKVNLYS